eukprot:jgi/Tetstr1/426606/TSEL_016883.t1
MGSPKFSELLDSTRTASTTPTSRAPRKPPSASASAALSGATTATGTAVAAAAKTSRLRASRGREAVAPRATFAKDATKDSGMGKAKVEAPSVDTAE